MRRDDRGRPPLRGDRLPGDGRRHHGAVRGAARPRGPRRPSLLRRPDACRRRSAATARRPASATASRCWPGSGSTPARSSSGRSPTTCTSSTRRSARPPTWPPGWSSLPCPGTVRLTAETLRLVDGLVEVRAAREDPGQGAGRASRGVRADRGRAEPPALPGRRRARPDPVRRAAGRAGRAPAGARPRPERPRPGRRAGRRAGRRQVAPALRVRPLAAHAAAGWCWRAARSRTARRPRTCR